MSSSRHLYAELYERGTDDYTDDQLIGLHGQLVEAGSHDGIKFCRCIIQQELFWRWYCEREQS